jgi:hypothetical protein
MSWAGLQRRKAAQTNVMGGFAKTQGGPNQCHGRVCKNAKALRDHVMEAFAQAQGIMWQWSGGLCVCADRSVTSGGRPMRARGALPAGAWPKNAQKPDALSRHTSHFAPKTTEARLTGARLPALASGPRFRPSLPALASGPRFRMGACATMSGSCALFLSPRSWP